MAVWLTAEELPADCTAAGIRVGSINEMAEKGVCFEFMLIMSGHDAERESKIWHYIIPKLAMLVPGLRVLLGWPALPYAQLGQGPKPASFDILILNCSALNEAALADFKSQLDVFIDFVLWLEPGFCSPDLLVGGKLRNFAKAMAATLVSPLCRL